MNYTTINIRNEWENPVTTTVEQSLEEWYANPLHGKFSAEVHEDHIDVKRTFSWLREGKHYPETEGFMIAVQDGVISTNNCKKYILKNNTVIDKFRKCKQITESIAHILNGCTLLTQRKYKERHDNAAKIIHSNILYKLGITSEKSPYYKYNPKSIIENNKYKIYWDKTIYINKLNRNDNTEDSNRPDIIIINKDKKKQ